MGARSCYSRYPSDFIGGVVGLGLEMIGAYTIILDLIYDRGGPIPDDDFWLGGICGCSSRKFRSVKTALTLAGKIEIKEGKISNRRAEKQIAKVETSQPKNFFDGNSSHFREKLDSPKSRQSTPKTGNNNNLAEISPSPPLPIPLDTTDKRYLNTAREEEPKPPPEPEPAPVVKIGKAITDLMGVSEDPRWLGNWSTVQQWLNEGFTEAQILQTASAVIQRKKASGQAMPGHLNYFTKAIRADWHVKPIALQNSEFKEAKRGSKIFKAWIADCKKNGRKTEWLEKQDVITVPISFMSSEQAA